MAKKKKYYVVWEGNNPGIYESWADCQLQIKGYPNAKFKSFPNLQEATEAYRGSLHDHIGVGQNKKKPKAFIDLKDAPIVWNSLSVDAACAGNPGVMEYQGVHTKDKSQFFYQKFPLGTNNIGEFLALVHALAMLHKQGSNTSIYSDSRIAMGWVKAGKCRTYALIDRAEKWLASHKGQWHNELLKWETKEWGEIPADFGRK